MTRPTRSSWTMLCAVALALGACSLNPQPEPPLTPGGSGGAMFDAGAGAGAAGSPGKGGAAGGWSGAGGAAGAIIPQDASDNPDGCQGDNCKCDVDSGACDAGCDAVVDAPHEADDGSPGEDADAETLDCEPDAPGQD